MEGGSSSGLDQHLELRDEVTWLERALAALPGTQREALLLCGVEQLSLDEAEARVRMDLAAIKGREVLNSLQTVLSRKFRVEILDGQFLYAIR